MRNAFARVLTELAQQDERVLLFYADIGNRLFNPLKAIAEERTINAGIAEANMASMAAGAAMTGHKPFIYTITPFTTARNFEQIKVDIAYQNQPVIIVGTGSGLAYANLGPTHHSFEDLALMRALPNMNVVCPADSEELEVLMPQLLELAQPVYLRIGKKNEPLVHPSKPALQFSKAHVMQPGEHIALLGTGTILPVVRQLYEELLTLGHHPELVSFHTVKPLDEAYLTTACDKFQHIVTVEEHNVNGGFGSAVLEWTSEHQKECHVHRFGIPDRFIDQVSGPDSAREKADLTVPMMLAKLKLKQVV